MYDEGLDDVTSPIKRRNTIRERRGEGEVSTKLGSFGYFLRKHIQVNLANIQIESQAEEEKEERELPFPLQSRRTTLARRKLVRSKSLIPEPAAKTTLE